jgi:hypothetical protein
MHEPAHRAFIRRSLRLEKLDGHEAVQVQVPRLIHHTHRSLCEELLNLIVRNYLADHGPTILERISHRHTYRAFPYGRTRPAETTVTRIRYPFAIAAIDFAAP